MERADNSELCSVVYYCPGTRQNFCDLYHHRSPPHHAEAAAAAAAAAHLGAHDEDPGLDIVLGNVRALLDEDQGGFREVFISSQSAHCLDRIESCANHTNTVVLVEMDDAASRTSPAHKGNVFPFLRALCADINGARYQRHVMPFALVQSHTTSLAPAVDADLTASCLSTGALDIIHSPFDDEAINRLVGHVKHITRPSARLLGTNMAQNLLDSILTTEPAKSASHRPDLRITDARRQIIENAIRSWHFPAQSFSMDELTYGALYMLEHMLQVPELEAYRVPRPQLMTFLLATRRQYKHSREVHYHNWRHAVDVTQSIYCFLLDIRLCPPLPDDTREIKHLNAVERVLTPVDGLMLLVSAIGHDVGHPGVNNAFLVACSHPLAHMYNDKSVLENYHCAAYFQLLRRHWPSLSGMPGFRSTMISNILATDMQRHFEYMANLGDLKRKIADSQPDLSDWAQSDWNHARELIMALLMKAADISNVARPFDISAQWARTLMNEFARQGELERELSIPTCLFGGPPDKEDALAAAQSQKGFMSLFGTPLFAGMRDVMPSMSCAIRELQLNDEQWDKRIAEEKQRREGGAHESRLTFSSVTQDEVEEAKIRHHRSEPFAVPDVIPHVLSSPTKRKTVLDPSVPSPSHPTSVPQHQLTPGATGHRASTPVLPPPALPAHLSPIGGASRRSSKDVALDSLQHHNTFAHTDLSSPTAARSTPASRRGSNDASWAVHQSYPGSRRGSKDESLTTILVTSQGSPRRASPSSPGKTPPRASPMVKADSKQNGRKRHSMSGAPPPVPPTTTTKDSASARYSHPSSRSHTMSSGTVTTTATQHSPSTQPSSLAPTDDEATPPAAVLAHYPFLQGNHVANHVHAVGGEDDPFLAHHPDGGDVPDTWSSDVDGTPHHASTPVFLAPSPKLAPKSDASPRIIARVASAESSDDHGRLGLLQRKADRGGSSAGSLTAGTATPAPLRESRSRSRLRGLRNFWRKNRNRETPSGVEGQDGLAGPGGGTIGSGGSGSP